MIKSALTGSLRDIATIASAATPKSEMAIQTSFLQSVTVEEYLKPGRTARTRLLESGQSGPHLLQLFVERLFALTVLVNHCRWRPVDERFILKFTADCRELLLEPQNFLPETFTFRASVHDGSGQNDFTERGHADQVRLCSLIGSVQRNVFCVQKLGERRNFGRKPVGIVRPQNEVRLFIGWNASFRAQISASLNSVVDAPHKRPCPDRLCFRQVDGPRGRYKLNGIRVEAKKLPEFFSDVRHERVQQPQNG